MTRHRAGSRLWLAALIAVVPAHALAQGPAVATPNGKVEFSAGVLDAPTGAPVWRAAGTLTLPVGYDYGVQADAFMMAPAGAWGGAVHVFTRDPSSSLFGGAAAFVRTPGAWLLAAGPEAELYFDGWSLEGWAGLALAKPDAASARLSGFARIDAAYYPDDNWRLSAGASFLDGRAALHLGTEYLFEWAPMPVSTTADVSVGADGNVRALFGLRVYLGESDKPLIRRHREDDPLDRGTALYMAAGRYDADSALLGPRPPSGEPPVTDPSPPGEEPQQEEPPPAGPVEEPPPVDDPPAVEPGEDPDTQEPPDQESPIDEPLPEENPDGVPPCPFEHYPVDGQCLPV
jgi:hypothetical protein